MSFVSAKCPQCGGALQVPNDRDSVKCMYCGIDVLVREAISLASINVNNFLVLARAAEKAENYVEAYDYFTKFLESNPKSSEAWVGKANSAGWQSNLIRNRFQEMLSCYENAINVAENEDIKNVIKIEAAISIVHVATSFFQMSTNHTIQFISVHASVFEHIDRCKDIVFACEKAYEYFPESDLAPNLIVTICNRITNIIIASKKDKDYFTFIRNKYIKKVTSPEIIKAAKSGSDCFVVTATMGDDGSEVVLLMRKFRDNLLSKSFLGRNFISWYYKNGPKYANIIRQSFVKRLISFLLIVLPCAIFAAVILFVFDEKQSKH